MVNLENKYRDYLRFEKNFSFQTEISYCSDLAEFSIFIKENYPLVSLIDADSLTIRAWVVQLMEKGLKGTSVNRKLSSLKSFYRYLTKLGYIKVSPLKNISGPKNKKSIPAFVNYSDIESILEIDKQEQTDSIFVDVRNKTILELFYMTGIRRAELIGLKDLDFDYDRKSVRIYGKRRKERIIPLSEATVNILQQYQIVRDTEVARLNDCFFVRENGEMLYPVLVYRIISSYLKMIPTLKKASPHVLRHSFATGMLNHSASLNAVKEVLGHASLSSTEIYTHTSFEELKKIYNQAHPRA